MLENLDIQGVFGVAGVIRPKIDLPEADAVKRLQRFAITPDGQRFRLAESLADTFDVTAAPLGVVRHPMVVCRVTPGDPHPVAHREARAHGGS